MDLPTSNGARESLKDHINSRRAAACLVCRRSKIKCEKGRAGAHNDDRCQRCLQLGVQCVRPDFHVGRRKGVKNKRTGLEKALHQVEEAVRRSGQGPSAAQNIEAAKVISELKALLGSGARSGASDGSGVAGESSSHHQARSGNRATGGRADQNHHGHHVRTNSMSMLSEDLPDASSDAGDSSGSELDGISVSVHHQGSSTPSHQSLSHVAAGEESLAVDDAENPLQLLARASDLHVSPKLKNESWNPHVANAESMAQQRARQGKQNDKMSEVEKFFKFSQFQLDTGPDLDPIDLGLVTVEEAETLFAFFHQNLAHTRWGLDPALYNVPFTRSRSAYLFTSIAAAAALFMPSASALSRRLSNHCKELVKRITAARYRSVEIVLAFMVNVPWMFPGKHSMDDETCWYVSMATTMALDLSLHKFLVPLATLKDGRHLNIARADCIDPKLALSLDGFGDVDSSSELGRRLLRRRERCWIALFVLERGMCLARGRSYTVPLTPSLRNCDQWHLSNIADTMDGHLVSMAVLRRDLDDLFASIRAVCDGSRETLADGAMIAQSIQITIEKFFEEWHAKWHMAIGQGTQHRLPPYVQILVTHTRLSIYSSVINHPTAPTEVRRFFHANGLSSALNVMRVAIQGESQLSSMPNNTAIMISFAACFALRLSGQIAGNSNLAPSVRTLIEETAEVLERIGSATKHRNGMSALYGKYLKYIVKKAAAAAAASATSTAADMTAAARHNRHMAEIMSPRQQQAAAAAAAAPFQRQRNNNNLGAGAAGFATLADPVAAPPVSGGFLEPSIWTEPIQFSSMSDDQIVEALSRVGNEFSDPGLSMYPWENDTAALDWLNWSNLPEFGN
ncbi:protein priB [Diplogelasinospora grovesii]|uniref:Protein priB n=1 Tax=Diplogelasinospora grovesii TaxID=303347 RepID=A0AAN6N139_9PEZI|nr:protein priB [Diplogelasinospora grovesii]